MQGQHWPSAAPVAHYTGPEDELPALETSTSFLAGVGHLGYTFSGKHAAGGWEEERRSPASPGIPSAYSQPQVFETISQLSLSDSPVKQALPRRSSLPQRQQHGDDWPAPAASAAPAAEELERTNAELSRRVQELQEQLAAERAAPPPPPSAFAGSADEREVRELQGRLAAKQREVQAAQEALERARAEAKATAAQLQQERGKSAGLLDEVAQWRDEYHKMKKEYGMLAKKLEASAAQSNLLDGNAGALRRENAELTKALAGQEAACRELQEQMGLLKGQEGNRHKQLQALLDQAEALERENAELRAALQAANADGLSQQAHLQQLWDEREQLHGDNAVLRQEVAELNAELQHLGNAFSATRAQLQDVMASRSGSLAGARQPHIQHAAYGAGPMAAPSAYGAPMSRPPASAAPPALSHHGQLPHGTRQDGTAEGRPNTAGSQQVWQQWGLEQLGAASSRPHINASEPGYGSGSHAEPQWATRHHSTVSVRPETAAAHERFGDAAPPPAAARSLTFEAQQGMAGASAGRQLELLGPNLSPLENFNPRASLPQPYHLTQPVGGAATTPELMVPAGDRGRLSFGENAAAGAPTPGAAAAAVPLPASQQLRSSTHEGEEPQPSPAPNSAFKAQRAAAIPFGNEETLQEMLARTQALEERLMRLSLEKTELEAEYARMPSASKKVQERRRRGEVEQRLEAVNKEISNIRLQLKRMGYK